MTKDTAFGGDDNYGLEDSNQPELRKTTRTTSFAMSKSQMHIFVVDKKSGKETLFEETDFESIEPLGRGSQGTVYAAKARFKNLHQELEVHRCVLKTVRRKRSSPNPFSAHKEISTGDQSSLEHKTIQLIEVIQDADGEYYALLPYCDMFLDNVINALQTMAVDNVARFRSLVTPLALHVLFDLCDAYISMHLDKEYVHADVKPANVGLYCNHWCLLDMDCSKKWGEPVTQYAGTVAFSHPSAIRDRNNTSLPWSDLFALGEILHLLFHPLEYAARPNKDIMREKDDAYRKALVKKYSGNAAVADSVPLIQMVQTAPTLEDKINIIIASLKEPLATDQMDVLELRSCVNHLKQNFQCGPDVIRGLEAFYDELILDGFFEAESATTLSESSLFSSSASFFSESGRYAARNPRNSLPWSLDKAASKKNSIDSTDDTDLFSDNSPSNEDPLSRQEKKI